MQEPVERTCRIVEEKRPAGLEHVALLVFLHAVDAKAFLRPGLRPVGGRLEAALLAVGRAELLDEAFDQAARQRRVGGLVGHARLQPDQVRGKARPDPLVPHPEAGRGDRRVDAGEQRVAQHHAQSLGERDQRSQMRIEKVGSRQPLVLAGDEVGDDAGEMQRAQRFASHLFAKIKQHAFARSGSGQARHAAPAHGSAAPARRNRSGRAVPPAAPLCSMRPAICSKTAVSPAPPGAEADLHVGIAGQRARCRRELMFDHQRGIALGRLALQLDAALHAVGIGPQRQPLGAMANGAPGVALLDRAPDGFVQGVYTSEREMRWAQSRSAGRQRFSRSSVPRCEAWPHTLTAASTVPRESRSGTEAATSPSSSSWSMIA